MTQQVRQMREKNLRDQALEILEEVRSNFPEYHEMLMGVKIRISRRLTSSAGNACNKTRTIGLSEPIFSVEENIPQFRNTVLHELAHLIAGPRAQAHGVQWRNIFISIGGNGERCHAMRAKRRHHRHLAHCHKCDSAVEVGTRIWNRLRAGSREYFHQECGGVVLAEDSEIQPGIVQKLARKFRQAFLFGTDEVA